MVGARKRREDGAVCPEAGPGAVVENDIEEPLERAREASGGPAFAKREGGGKNAREERRKGSHEHCGGVRRGGIAKEVI